MAQCTRLLNDAAVIGPRCLTLLHSGRQRPSEPDPSPLPRSPVSSTLAA